MPEQPSSPDGPRGLVEERRRHRTVLDRRGPSPQPFYSFEVEPFAEVKYTANGRALKGWLAFPESSSLARDGRWPVLVHLHGGFAVGESDLEDTRPFLEAGLAVFVPSFRGENGNPGWFEFAYGEVDDARAALRFIRQNPRIDAERAFVFGHSSGGLIAGLLALYPDLGVKDTGSVGALYDEGLFDEDAFRPFRDSEKERALRVFAPSVDQLRTPHFACVGRQDLFPMVMAGAARAP